jgi:hypothetical protein
MARPHASEVQARLANASRGIAGALALCRQGTGLPHAVTLLQAAASELAKLSALLAQDDRAIAAIERPRPVVIAESER